MMHHHTLRLTAHATALLCEGVGTAFILLDTVRLNGMVKILGNASFDGEPERFHSWYYHSAVVGFFLLFGGMLLAAFVLWLEHLVHIRTHLETVSVHPAASASPATTPSGQHDPVLVSDSTSGAEQAAPPNAGSTDAPPASLS